VHTTLELVQMARYAQRKSRISCQAPAAARPRWHASLVKRRSCACRRTHVRARQNKSQRTQIDW